MTDHIHFDKPTQVSRIFDPSVVYLTCKDMHKRHPDVSVRAFQELLKNEAIPSIPHRNKYLVHPADFQAWEASKQGKNP